MVNWPSYFLLFSPHPNCQLVQSDPVSPGKSNHNRRRTSIPSIPTLSYTATFHWNGDGNRNFQLFLFCTRNVSIRRFTRECPSKPNETWDEALYSLTETRADFFYIVVGWRLDALDVRIIRPDCSYWRTLCFLKLSYLSDSFHA